MYIFLSFLLQDCNIYYFVSQCVFSHALETKFLTYFIYHFLLFDF